MNIYYRFCEMKKLKILTLTLILCALFLLHIFNTNATGSYTFTATDFKRWLKTVDHNTFTTSWDRKKLSNCTWEWENENITATAWDCNYWWVLTIDIDWDRFTYTWTTDHDVCSITLSAWDGQITVKWEFYYCTNPDYKETCKPHANPEIISWENFIDYKDFNSETRKYTSWTQVVVKLNAGWVNDLQSYRVSCIQQEIYCRELFERKPSCTEEQDFCTKLNTFLEWLKGKWKTAKVCATYENARSERIDYPDNDKFNRDIENSSGCEVVWDIPYGSRDQWPRKIRVQVKDTDWLTGDITGTEIPVNYSTGSPTLTWTYTPTYDEVILIWSKPVKGERKKTLQHANNTNFTTTVIANWAQLNNGTVWLNHEYENEMITHNILRTSLSDGPKLLYFDDLHEWIISAFGN